MINLRHAAAAAFVVTGLLSTPAFAASPGGYADVVVKGSQISVTGQGNVSAPPDLMRLQAGVEVRRATAGEAFKAARLAAAKLTKALLGSGLAEKDLRTSELTLGPEYENYPKIVGYRATQGVEAVVRDLTKADKVIDAAAAVGEDARLNGISFEISDQNAILVAARDAAYRDATAKAEHYAKLTGRKLGKILTVREDGGHAPGPIPFHGAMAMADKASISPGQQAVGLTVDITFELK
ncbi:SIMPL domain-containing protein [Acrocarpospora corrugata]|uniref:SIMPL domain-containing protein n=1 Tax=Acrocarpospora corrugata TaxID=35763 RepID=A0A5M3VPX6_9ACTN|nr:SIMPL domain-containing protein [Acrocarpospora corrugata]GER98846.1 SIMPL domain-containing protein [Acrocarpospora corrugata]